MPIRKIIRIDEQKCDGCGQCANACLEGAIQIIDGKARLVSESYCDGLGACIGERARRNGDVIKGTPAAHWRRVMDRGALDRELKVLNRFVEVYCRRHHGSNTDAPCVECNDLLDYARRRLEKCPYDPKPKCKDCSTHCYKPIYRQKTKAVMRFSGLYFVKGGRLDWLVRYFMM